MRMRESDMWLECGMLNECRLGDSGPPGFVLGLCQASYALQDSLMPSRMRERLGLFEPEHVYAAWWWTSVYTPTYEMKAIDYEQTFKSYEARILAAYLLYWMALDDERAADRAERRRKHRAD